MLKLTNKKITILFLSLILFFGFFQLADAVIKNIGETATITVTCSDPDGNLNRCIVTSPCIQSCLASGSSGSCSCGFTCTTPGIYNVCGKALDTEALEDSQCLDTVNCGSLPDKPQPVGDGETWSHCSFGGKSIPTFHWTYSDPGGDPQSAYEIWVDSDVIFADPKFNYLVNLAATSYVLDLCHDDDAVCTDWITELAWDTTYYWKVKVKDNNNNWSEWSDPNQFTTPLHAYPRCDFTHQPLSPVAKQVVTFFDDSTCYDSFNNPYSCSEINPETGTYNTYEWDFSYEAADGFNLEDAKVGDTNYTYSESGDYTVMLRVTDDLGTCDTTGDTPVEIQLPLPEYREIPPIIWLKRIFAGVVDFFNGFLKL